jgi:TolB-like protein/DNA-binding winged helix-turn-helix (wHTH) protein/Tfp pilus assembly protein PilF
MRFLFGDCILDATRRELSRGDKTVHVEPQVFDLLLHLIRNRDQVVSKDELLAAVWDGRIVSESTLSNRINSARRAIGDSGEHQHFIRTVARRGFRFVGDVRQEPTESKRNEVNAPPARNEPVPPYGVEEDRNTLLAAGYGFDGKATVAVLPFTNMSGDPEQEYFSDGITEDIITLLSKHRSLLVTARNSVFAFKGHGGDVRRIGTELCANYIVEGSVRKVGRTVRITAHLIETEGGRVVWADQYDRDLEEIFELQDEITKAIAARIEPSVSAAERLRAGRKPPEALQAWDFFHLGLKNFYKFASQDSQEAQRLFRRAVALDPNLAQAHAYLAYAVVLDMLYFDAEPDEHLLNEAESLARKGAHLDDQDALIRFIHGRVLLARQAYGDALAELEAALSLNPSLPAVYCGLGDTLAYEGRYSDAIPYFEKAINLSQHDPQRWAYYSYGALAQLFALKFSKALDWAQKATHIPNCHYWPFAHRVAALGHLHRTKELRTAVAELLQRRPGFSQCFARKRLFYVKKPAQLDVYIEGLRRAGIPA